MTEEEILDLQRDVSKRLTWAVSNYKQSPSAPLAETARRVLAEHVALTMEHGALARKAAAKARAKAGALYSEGFAELYELRAKALDIVSIWRRVDSLTEAGISTKEVVLPCRYTAAAFAKSSTESLNNARRSEGRAAEAGGVEVRPPERRAKAKARAEMARAKAEALARAAAVAAGSPPVSIFFSEPTELTEPAEPTFKSSADLIAEARTATTARRDEIWREARFRKWTRQQMRAAFDDPVTK